MQQRYNGPDGDSITTLLTVASLLDMQVCRSALCTPLFLLLPPLCSLHTYLYYEVLLYLPESLHTVLCRSQKPFLFSPLLCSSGE